MTENTGISELPGPNKPAGDSLAVQAPAVAVQAPATATRPADVASPALSAAGLTSSAGLQPGSPPTAVVPESGCACGGTGECTCGTSPSSAYVYAIGTVTARFPSLNIEKEFMQAWGKNPEQVLKISDSDKFAVLSQGQNLYLAREMCWVFQSGDIDLYILRPRSYVELTDLVTCLVATPNQVSYALIIGTLGPIAPASLCNGAQLPLVTCNQVFSFTGQAFINSIVNEVTKDPALIGKITPPEGGTAAQPAAPGTAGLTQQQLDTVTNAATNAFSVLTLLTDNTGQTDEHRAINYLTFKSRALYTKEIEMEQRGFTLNSVTAQPDSLSGTRRIQDVILLYASTSTTQVERYFTRIDVSGQFPFMVNDLAIYYDHP
jgi:hypothetical protein